MQNNEILVDIYDYKSIFLHNGRIDGKIGSCNKNEFSNELDESLEKSLLNAKAVLIKFGLHKNQSLFIINDFLSKVNNLVNVDTEIIFGTQNIDDIDEDKIKYEIIITGL